MTTPCEKTEVINIIKDDVKEIKGDMKDLLKFKNQILGIVIATSTICTVLAQVVVLVIKEK